MRQIEIITLELIYGTIKHGRAHSTLLGETNGNVDLPVLETRKGVPVRECQNHVHVLGYCQKYVRQCQRHVLRGARKK